VHFGGEDDLIPIREVVQGTSEDLLTLPNGIAQLQRELARAGLPPLRFHDLRHSTASLLAFAGVPARVAMEVLGHRQISTTMDIYTKVYPEVRREAAEALDKVLGPRLAE
jgi:integrase